MNDPQMHSSEKHQEATHPNNQSGMPSHDTSGQFKTTDKDAHQESNSKKSDKTEEYNSKSDNIFQNNPTKANVFGHLFGEGTSVNLFNVTANNIPTSNIFNRCANQKPLIPDQSDSEGREKQDPDPEALNNQGSKQKGAGKVSPVKGELKFDYQKPSLQKIKDFKVSKFRNGTNLTKDFVNISLEKSESQSSVLYLSVKSRETHIFLYQALIMKTISKVQDFMGKEENIKMTVVKPTKVEGQKTAPIKQIVKLQFETAEQCKDFKEIVCPFVDQ